MFTVYTYITYLVISITMTIWVAQTLFKNGRLFLLDTFRQNEPLADAVNHLLLVGFYLINIGCIALALKYGPKPGDLSSSIEISSSKIGLVLIVLGCIHFFNLYVLSQMRNRAIEDQRIQARRAESVPPLLPLSEGATAMMARLRGEPGQIER